MRFSFQHPASPPRGTYVLVDSLREADFAVVDANSASAVKGVVQAGRLDRALFVGSTAPDGALARLPRPIDPTRILRTLDEVTAQIENPLVPLLPGFEPGVAEGSAGPPHVGVAPPSQTTEAHQPTLSPIPAPLLAPMPTPRPGVLPVLDDSVVYPKRDDALPASAEVMASLEVIAANRPPPPPAKADQRAAARRASRRARLASGSATASTETVPRDVLVLDADADASAALCDLLRQFGFVAHAVDSVAQARAALVGEHFVALFADVPLDDSDGGDGLELVQRAHRASGSTGRPETAVLIVSQPLHPAERVIASLAGVGAPLEKPVTRGAVARALESRGVVLPADSRRV